MTTFEHKGTTITLLSDGKFRAEIRGKTVVKGSLKAMHQAIEAPASFAPFKGLIQTSWTDPGYISVEVRSVNKSRGRYGRTVYAFEGKTEDGKSTHEDAYLYPDTEENRAALAALRQEHTAYRAACEAESERHSSAVEKIEAKLSAQLSASEYGQR